jgi:hypothetical protein
MSEYVPLDPAVADKVHQSVRESREQYQRLEHAPAERLKQIVRDPAERAAARGNALLILFVRRDAEVPDILPELFEDPDLGHMAIHHCPLADPRVVAKLRALLDHPRDGTWSEAAVALAKAKDVVVRTRLLDWFHTGDEGHRNVAIEGLIQLGAPDTAELFGESWTSGGRGEEDCLVLAAALLRLNDARGLESLTAAAQKAKGAWAVFAATAIADYDEACGYRLMLWILDKGDLQAKRALVSHAWNMARLPHAFTADGIHETRLWIEQQLKSTRPENEHCGLSAGAR